MNHADFAKKIIATVQEVPANIPSIVNEETRRNNAARCMSQLFCNRLSSNGTSPRRVKHSTFQWQDGLIALRNARIVDHHWSTLRLNVAEQFHKESETKPVVYMLTNWVIEDGVLHAWVIPEDVAYLAFAELPIGRDGTYKTVELFPDTHELKNAPNAPDLSPYYFKTALTSDEVEKLVEAIKIDHAAKRAGEDETGDELEDEETEEDHPFFTSATVAFLKELPDHVEDAQWHDQNKKRYQRVLRDPARALVEALRDRYIERLSPEVAGGKRHSSILKKNDYGKGGYHDHYWFAFYDPNAGSKTKSVQLFFRMLGSKQVWRYGFAMGNYCADYLQRLQTAIQHSAEDVAAYVRSSLVETRVRLRYGDEERRLSPEEFAGLLQSETDCSFDNEGKLTSIDIIREYALDSLTDHDNNLVDEVGQFFTWAWPFFEASMTGIWPKEATFKGKGDGEADEEEDVDEDAPTTLKALTRLQNYRRKQSHVVAELREQGKLNGAIGTRPLQISTILLSFNSTESSWKRIGNHTFESEFSITELAANGDGSWPLDRPAHTSGKMAASMMTLNFGSMDSAIALP